MDYNYEDNNKVVSETFRWLFIGLLVFSATAFFTSQNDALLIKLYLNQGWVIFLILELVLSIILGLFIKKLSPVLAKSLYVLYTAFTGLSFNGIFFMYKLDSIVIVLFITAIIFGIFAYIGSTTKLDLSKWGVYLGISLISIIIVEIINLFVLSNTLNMILCSVTIIVFCLYTAFDINRLTKGSYLNDSPNKGIYYAFQLFLDFINIFIELLKLFGKRKD